MNNKKITFSLVFNFFIVIATLVGIIYDLMENSYFQLIGETSRPIVLQLKYYTILSNLILGIVALIFIVYDFFLLVNKINEMPIWVTIIKMCTTTGTTITMLVVFFILTPGILAGFGRVNIDFLYGGTSAIFHVITPILGILTFILFETNREVKLLHCCFGMIFTELYSIFYVAEALTHFLPTYDVMSHDWYNFVMLVSPNFIPLSIIVFAGFAFFITWLLWLCNRKIRILEKTVTL